MTEERLVLADLLEKAGDGDFLRAVAEAVLQLLMESDVEGMIGAGRYERSGERTTWRNGYRDRTLDTRLAALQLRIPKLRQGSYFPPFLEARKSSEKALIAVIQEAWIGGVSTRRVDDLVQAMGLSGISESQVSKLCKEIDERVHAFLDRPLAGEWPYLWLDATYLKLGGGLKGSPTGRCQGCNHSERVRIERLLAAGASIKGAARKFAIDYHALHRHWRNHVSAEARATYVAGAGATKDQLEEIVAAESLGLIDHYRIVRAALYQGFSAAAELADSNSLTLLAGRLHENFRDCGRLTGELQRGPLLNIQNNILVNPDYTRAIARIVGAVATYPEARETVIGVVW